MTDENLALSNLMNAVEAVCAGGCAWARSENEEAFQTALAAVQAGHVRPRLIVEFEDPSVARLVAVDGEGQEVLEVFRYSLRPLNHMDLS